ncbi:MAG: DMT family transporter [Saprospiraceae bacterium]|nr:DMT family transporter [Saprospiraceae bacterium]
MDSLRKSFILLHIGVFLFGFTGILGKLILLPALILVWWRSLLTWILLLPQMFKNHGFQTMNRKSLFTFLGIGVLVGLHWICFYGSIKLSNSSIAMICLAFIPLFTAFFEAWFHKKKLKRLDIFIGLITLPGMWMILQNIELNYRLGFGIGILAAILSASFATLNKKYISKSDPISITWIELFSVWLFMTILLPVVFIIDPSANFLPSKMDWLYLFILSYLCTVVSYVFVVRSLKNLSAFTAMLAFNLEPVYGIILAVVLIQEHKQLNGMFYLGVIIILASVFLHPFLEKNLKSFTKLESD